ncbi:MAG TPA: DinB family protein [Bryobacteraceae bacterium]|nr:DinB family protein [Bryobacteraceae bacterium]
MKLLTAALLVTAVASAQETPANPLVTVSKNVYGIAKNDILRSAEKIPESLWSFQPTPEVRTIGQLFAHVADGQYEFCGVAAEGHSVSKGIEKTDKTKAQILPALQEAFAFCDAAYAKMTDANAAEMVNFMGMRITKLGAMDFNTAHTMEHYGNLVTYMRLKGIVPPSSEPRQAGGSKKK